MSVNPSPDDRLLHLARRLLAGEAIDWEKEQVPESEVREGMKQLQHLLKPAEPAAQTESEEAPVRERSSRFIGDFRLVRKLGEGGMGVVYEAEQQHPKRPVALKVIRGGANVSKDTLKLFRREIQTLARLNHSCIAQLYEAGATDDGMHFFAMELIRGVPLSDWQKSRPEGALTPAELKLRLSIFRKICDAVAYAHQKGVVHRDVKPGNVLIPKPTAGSSMPDAVPEVKILDFGLARITDSDVQATTFVTEIGRVQGTLPYMSPEQVRGNSDELDLRTDVYSLGVMLYEMVTGHLPYDISKAQLPEAVRIICDEPPKSLASTFSGRKRLDADVITIATKCLEKEPARRYQSAIALSEDVQRWLTDQPILARRPSAAYQLRKLVLRHKLLFAFAGAVFVLLAVFAGAMTFQAARIARERDRANQAANRATQEAAAAKAVSDFLEEMFTLADPSASRGGAITAKEILEAGAARVQETLGDQPLIQARLMSTMGSVYHRLWLHQDAERLLRQAAELQRRSNGEKSPEYAKSLNRLAWTLMHIDQMPEARALLRTALGILESAGESHQLDTAWSRYYLGNAAPNEEEKRTHYAHALKIFENDPEHGWQGLAWTLQDGSWSLFGEGMKLKNHGDAKRGEELLAQAFSLQRRAVEVSERHLPAMSSDLVAPLCNMGFRLYVAGRPQEAEPYMRRAVAVVENNPSLPADHYLRSFALDNLGTVLTLVGKYEEAGEVLHRALSASERVARHMRPIVFQDLADLEQARGRFALAETHYREAIRLREGEFPNDGGLVETLEHYASLLNKMARIPEAEQAEARAKELRAKLERFDQQHPRADRK